MRIALVTDESCFTGIGKYSQELQGGLQSAGIDSDLYAVQWSSKPKLRLEGARAIRPLPVPVPLISVESFLAGLRRNSLLPSGYDVYHVAEQFLIQLLPSSGTKVATIHDLKPLVIPQDYPYMTRRMLRRAVRGVRAADLIIVDSLSTKSDVESLLGVPEDLIRVISLGRSEEFHPREPNRKALGLPEGSKILMNVGTEDPSKNMPFLFRVLRGIKSKLDDVLLLRVGKKGQASDNLIHALGLERNVTYLTGLSDEDLSKYYSSADLLVHPSLYEGFGLPPLEAMASGCAVVCSNRSSLPEVVGDAGLVLPLEEGRWVDGVLNLLRNEGERDGLRKLGIERGSAFTWSKCAKETAEAYRKAIK